MVWYMLKTALFYSNFEDIHRKIEQLLGRRTSHIIEATITSYNSGEKQQGSDPSSQNYQNLDKYDLTFLLNTWMTSLRTPDLKNFLVLGAKGQLTILKDLINLWEKHADPGNDNNNSNMDIKKQYKTHVQGKPTEYANNDVWALSSQKKNKNFTLGNKNTLVISYVFEGDVLNYELIFDKNWQVMQQETNIPTKNLVTNELSLVVLENINTQVNVSEYMNIMTGFSEIGVIMNYGLTYPEEYKRPDKLTIDYSVYLDDEEIYCGKLLTMDNVNALSFDEKVAYKEQELIKNLNASLIESSIHSRKKAEADPKQKLPLKLDAARVSLGVSIEFLLKKIQKQFMRSFAKCLEENPEFKLERAKPMKSSAGHQQNNDYMDLSGYNVVNPNAGKFLDTPEVLKILGASL